MELQLTQKDVAVKSFYPTIIGPVLTSY